MVDTLTKKHRSWNMAQIKGANTIPEMIVRSLLHRLGYRFRCQQKIIIGPQDNQVAKHLECAGKHRLVKPDITAAKYKTVVFVHGCFWHRHKGCKDATMPKSRTEWWRAKLGGNAARDRRNQSALRREGWRVLIVWECETAKPERLKRRIEKFFTSIPKPD